ncbi:hypothetical protein B0H21DRAFT_754758 [Amylocystis lapponica]|nr:hypothetical protein B0H21DRAFT_754758 [Amylocystis lapponica]
MHLQDLSVSRYLLEVIDRSECLQYNIDLAIAGMMDGPSSVLCTAERRSMLREHQKAWGSVQLSVQSTLYIPPVFHRVPTPHRIFGNVLLEHAPGGLRCTQLPSRIRGMEEKRWSIDCVAIAPGFDLLVLLECRYNRVPIHVHAQSYRNQTHYRAQIRVLSMSDGTTHPAALGWLVFQKMSLKLARPSIQVWNWKTGDLVWVRCDLSARRSFLHLDPRTFSFLDENHMIVMYKRRLAATSEHFVVSLMSRYGQNEVDRIIIFPRAGSSDRIVVLIRPSKAPHPIRYTSFRSTSVHSMDDIFWYLFIPAPTIRACIARARKDSKTRDLTWQADVAAQQWDMTRIHVLEFGPVVRHHMQTCMLRGDTVDVDDGCEGKAAYVTTAYRVDGAEAFFTDVTTQLPFRTSWRDVAQNGVMIQRRDTGWQLHSL